MTTITITELTNIGSNIAYTTLVPVVNMTGTPETQKANLQIVGNLILNQAGGNFVAAAKANTVVNAAQANITSVGTLTGLNVSGNANLGNITFNNATMSSKVAGAPLEIVGNGAGNINLSSNSIINISTANITNPDGGVQLMWVDPTNPAALQVAGLAVNTGFGVLANNQGNVQILATANAANGLTPAWTFGNDGNLTLPANSFQVNYANGNPVPLGSGTYNNSNVASFLAAFGSNSISTIGDITGANIYANNISSPANTVFTIYANAKIHNWEFGTDGTFYAPDNVVVGGQNLFVGTGANLLPFTSATLVISADNIAFVQAVVTNVSDIGSADWVAYGHHGNDDGGFIDIGFTSASFDDPDFTITGAGDGYILVEAYVPGQAPFIGGGNLILGTGVNGTQKDIIFSTGGFTLTDEFMRISDANNAIEFYDLGNISGANVISIETLIANAEANVLTLTTSNISSPSNINVTASGNTWQFSNDGNLTLPGNTSSINNTNGTPYGSTVIVTAAATGAQTITNAASAQVLAWTEISDTSNSFASNIFTAPFNGFYQVNLSLYWGAGVTQSAGFVSAVINPTGSFTTVDLLNGPAGSGAIQNVSRLIQLAQGDELAFLCAQTTGSDQTPAVNGTTLSIYRIG
jgi:hypothetical protein